MAKQIWKRLPEFFKNSLKTARKRWKLLAVLAVIAALLGWWQYNRIQNNKPVYETETPQRQDLVRALEVSGIIDAKEKVQLRFLVGGKVVYLGAEEGDWVEQWQTIASIDQATLQKQLEQDLNNYLRERWQADQYIYDSRDDYWQRSVVRQREYNQLDMEQEVLDVEIRDIAIRDANIYAPFAGILTHAPTTSTGVQLLSTDYFELVNPETLIFLAEVDEADIAEVQLGQQAEINLDAYPDRTINSTVTFIDYTSSQTSTSTVFLVEVPIPAFSLEEYRIGMNGDISIILETEPNALTVPLLATRERDDKTYVDVKNGQELEEREIQVGLETDEYVQVLGGLSESDQVVIPE